MAIDVTVMIGGEAGQGIQTVGQLLAQVCKEAGLYLMAINDFESRIRGGHSFFQIRISDSPLSTPRKKVHLLVAMDERTFDLHEHELADNGLVLTDGQEMADRKNVHAVSISELAKKAGGAIMANTIAAGACLALLGAPIQILQDILIRQFQAKGDAAVDNNLSAAESG